MKATRQLRDEHEGVRIMLAILEKLCEKLRNATGQLTFEKVLSDICGFIALFSPDRARAYFDFWNEIINRRQQLRKTGS